jgi:hypothetical protein
VKEGDRVVVRGNFLLDSQFQIAGLPSLFYPTGQAPPTGHAGHGGMAMPATKGEPPPTNPSGHEGMLGR